MQYASGEVIRLKDKVKLWPGVEGEVVAILDSREFSADYPESEWGYLKRGILIHSAEAGLIHFFEPEHSMELIKRSDDRS